eukprot:TRINITY_DN5051_c0_g1_i1.p1 TRINITY_DN5051_c0_g1~~TRINITY_DN5051_c0_g1_i1.p1  ORF type:complete len:154 (-),score=13.84 TRINITY_DN5051_c0_g1_i1:205-609(-)
MEVTAFSNNMFACCSGSFSLCSRSMLSMFFTASSGLNTSSSAFSSISVRKQEPLRPGFSSSEVPFVSLFLKVTEVEGIASSVFKTFSFSSDASNNAEISAAIFLFHFLVLLPWRLSLFQLQGLSRRPFLTLLQW